MYLYWHGQTCIKLVDGDFTLLIDPFDKTSGLRQPRYAANVVLVTSTDPKKNLAKLVSGDPLVIAGPGEYEAGGTFINGIASPYEDAKEQVTMYEFERGGISFAHLGALNQHLSEDRLDMLEGADVLLIPVGGHGALNAEQAAKLVSEIEPRIIIPIQYQVPGLTHKLDGVSAFASEMGVKNVQAQDKIKLVKKELPQDQTNVVILNKT